jgi:hypothetical protein
MTELRQSMPGATAQMCTMTAVILAQYSLLGSPALPRHTARPPTHATMHRRFRHHRR